MAPKPTLWPRFCAPPADVLKWLGKLRPADKAGRRAVLTLRWLLVAELDRSVPEPAQPINPFTPAEPLCESS